MVNNLPVQEEEEVQSFGPVSFIDSGRVNAGLESGAEDDMASRIPADLWREDTLGIKKENKDDGHEHKEEGGASHHS